MHNGEIIILDIKDFYKCNNHLGYEKRETSSRSVLFGIKR